MQPAELQGARQSAIPASLTPMLATPIEQPFSNPQWLFEIKWDGVRALAWMDKHKIKLRSRAQNDVTTQYPELAALPEALNARQALLDGEIVVLDERGRSDFGRLQQRMNVRTPSPQALAQFPVTYYVFDLLHCDGYDLRHAPLLERKKLLRHLLRPHNLVRFSDHEPGRGEDLYALAQQNGLEGIIGKRAASRYVSARSKDWVKIKATNTLNAVIGGWTAPRGSRARLGSLLLGLYEGDTLRFIGHAGSGFNEKTLDSVAKDLQKHQAAVCPFDKKPQTNEKAFWTKASLVARVRFQGWTHDKRLRAPVFMGLEPDIRARDCRWEDHFAQPAPAAPETALR
jgi:bifunctional non-homologous end joining protein LigD